MKISSSSVLRTFLFLTVVFSSLFVGGVKAEAGTTPTTWYYQVESGTYYSVCQPVVYSSYTCVESGYYGDSPTYSCTQITPDPGYVWVDVPTQSEDIIYTQQCLISSQYTNYSKLATFAASTNKDTYAPGDTVTVSVAAASGDQGSTMGGFFSGGLIYSINNSFLNPLCVLFCSSPPGVGADAYLGNNVNGGFNAAHCDASGSCTGTGSGFAAPTTPGTYTIALSGWWTNSTQNIATSNMSYTVACPSTAPIWNSTSKTCDSCASPNVWDSTTNTCYVPVTGVCDNTGGYNCAPGSLGTHSGDATNGWTWYCDGTPNDTAHRSSLCSYKPSAVSVVNGSCSTTHYTCTSPTASTNNVNGTSAYTWTCPGTGTGTSASCTENKVPLVTWTNYCTGGSDVNGNNWQIWAYSNETPAGWKYVAPGTVTNGCVATAVAVNGSCSSPSAHYTCTSPTASTNNVNGTSAYTWTCPGTGTGTSASCTENKASVTWTNYCTGTDATATPPHPWQIWAYSNETPAGWKFVENGTVANNCTSTCAPTNTCGAASTICSGSTCSTGCGAVITGTKDCSICTPASVAEGYDVCTSMSTSTGCLASYYVCPTATGCCQSAPNSCGQTTNGTYTVDCTGATVSGGACNAIKPDDPPVTATISVVPTRVKAIGTTLVSWTTGGATSCSITKNGSLLKTLPYNSSCVLTPPTSVTDTNVTTQSIYTILCTNSVNGQTDQKTSNIVNVVPSYQEF